ncbi:MAG: formylmethanofuran dehydrogenase subunit C, partial [Candidatus Aenigmarchaeota archaeon]|nr:formylmethanofuran dehydrogenase subunit C [Candidatus Aenigmarchaeota archaeon]
MVITLYPKSSFKVPIEAECINPDVFAEKSVTNIAKLQIWEGNRKRILGDLFKIEPNPDIAAEKVTIRISGDVSKVRRIGAKMTMGEIIIDGDVGMHLGEEMKGGVITVTGNAGSWLGSMMKNGTIEVKGN